VALSLVASSTSSGAQSTAAQSAHVPLPRRVTLRICPRIGDTLRMRYDQQVDMTGVRQTPPSGQGSVHDSTVTRTTTLLVLSRAIVEKSDTTGTELLAVTDSVAIGTTGGSAPQSGDLLHRLLGNQVRVRVAPDGATSLVDSAGVSPELRAVFAQMPATLPREAIPVGHSWDRTMTVPVRGGGGGGATLTSTFRLDSLSRDGSSAYISMRGALRHDAAHDPAAAMRVSITGTVAGTMVVDRRRGWLTDSHAVIAVNSVLAPPPADSSPPTLVRMTVTQWLRTVN
jgi:uncharacterized protein DUF6263